MAGPARNDILHVLYSNLLGARAKISVLILSSVLLALAAKNDARPRFSHLFRPGRKAMTDRTAGPVEEGDGEDPNDFLLATSRGRSLLADDDDDEEEEGVRRGYFHASWNATDRAATGDDGDVSRSSNPSSSRKSEVVVQRGYSNAAWNASDRGAEGDGDVDESSSSNPSSSSSSNRGRGGGGGPVPTIRHERVVLEDAPTVHVERVVSEDTQDAPTMPQERVASEDTQDTLLVSNVHPDNVELNEHLDDLYQEFFRGVQQQQGPRRPSHVVPAFHSAGSLGDSVTLTDSPAPDRGEDTKQQGADGEEAKVALQIPAMVPIGAGDSEEAPDDGQSQSQTSKRGGGGRGKRAASTTNTPPPTHRPFFWRTNPKVATTTRDNELDNQFCTRRSSKKAETRKIRSLQDNKGVTRGNAEGGKISSTSPTTFLARPSSTMSLLRNPSSFVHSLAGYVASPRLPKQSNRSRRISDSSGS